MQFQINEYTIKSAVRNVLYTLPHFKDCDHSTIKHENVIAVVCSWTYQSPTQNISERPVALTELLELIRQELGESAIEDMGLIENYRIYKVRFLNMTWYLRDMKVGYSISFYNGGKFLMNIYSFRSPEEDLSFMIKVDSLVPDIRKRIDDVLEEKAKKNMICKMMATSAKGLIDQIIEEEQMNIPKIVSISGRANKRVVVEFIDGREIDCPLNYLRSRLIRMFGKRNTLS